MSRSEFYHFQSRMHHTNKKNSLLLLLVASQNIYLWIYSLWATKTFSSNEFPRRSSQKHAVACTAPLCLGIGSAIRKKPKRQLRRTNMASRRYAVAVAATATHRTVRNYPVFAISAMSAFFSTTLHVNPFIRRPDYAIEFLLRWEHERTGQSDKKSMNVCGIVCISV